MANAATVTLPDEIFQRLTELAREEKRAVSDLIGAALSEYEENRWWADINAYGAAKAHGPGLEEACVEDLVHEVRREMRARRAEAR